MSDATSAGSDKLRILVSGDIVVDHHLYQGERPSPTERGARGVRHVPKPGGAEGLKQLLKALLIEAKQLFGADDELRKKTVEAATEAARQNHKSEIEIQAATKMAANNLGPRLIEPLDYDLSLGVKPVNCEVPNGFHHAFAIWQPYPLDRSKPDKEKVWRTNRKMGYGHDPIESVKPTASAGFALEPAAGTIPGLLSTDLLVLDDAGFLFRQHENNLCWHLPAKPAEDGPWILLKLSDPIAKGDLWHALMRSEPGQPTYADRLICVVSADDLRNEAVRITRGGAWETTLEDLAKELARDGLKPLTSCRHLLVVFDGDAVLWIERNAEVAHFCFMPSAAEGDFAAQFQGESIGYMTTMAAALAYGLSQGALAKHPGLAPWMEAGLRGMRDLLQYGHGEVSDRHDKQPDGYPVQRLAKAILGRGAGELARADVPWPPPSSTTRSWMILESSQRPPHAKEPLTLVGLAGEVLRRGKAAYGRLPHARYGKFITAERSEIEMLRGIRKRMLEYKPTPKANEKPLSIGIFGPPGAGKSFAVREIAIDVFGKTAWLEFNLSQFDGNNELNGALHQVRDKVLDGEVPVVFWDEFDTQNFKWLQFLLAPMQDGRFQDGELSHNVGRSVFIFAGGTSRSWSDFGRTPSKADEDRLKLLKVPDFKSRLDLYYDVAGPNPRWLLDRKGNPMMAGGIPRPDKNDVGYTMRRALLIRGQLQLPPDATLEVDTDLLRALLLVPQYENGARSLEKLVKPLAGTPGMSPGGPSPPPPAVLRRSGLPPPALLGISVNAAQFNALLDAGRAFIEDRLAEEMAASFHAAYRKDASAKGWHIQPHIDVPFEQLDPDMKQDNVAAARRLPLVLALAGMGIEPVDAAEKSPGPDSKTLEDHLRRNLERLAEAEHDGWWEFRRRNGWTQGSPRDDANRIHPLMVPYEKLSEAAKERDRDTVLRYGAHLADAGYRVVWL